MTQTPLEKSAIGLGFEAPYIDVDERRDSPLPHGYVHGGFEGTGTRFSFYFPPAELYERRFFQHVTPVPDSENLAQTAIGREGKIDFAIASGAYFVETNGGGPDFAMPGSGGDPTISAYRANAAAADYSRTMAGRIYGEHRPYGYLYGGSGGGFRTMGAAENTAGIWDGYVPYVIGSPLSIPNVFTVRMHAMRILRDRFDIIDDAFAPGGSGDPYPLLNEEEAAAFTEVTRMGFPPRSWFGWRTMGAHAFSVLYGGLGMFDPDYFSEFWTTDGYLGADLSSSIHRDRLRFNAAVAEVICGVDDGVSHGPRGGVDQAFRGAGDTTEQITAIRLDTRVPIDAQLADLVVTSGAAEGARLTLRSVVDDIAVLDIPGSGRALEGMQPGDTVTVDNSNVLAAQTYHRHQVPAPEYRVWDQFRHPDGTPIYPQRPMLVGPIFAQAASGTTQTGKFEGKMIVVSCLLDREAFAWQADWYASKVKEHLGKDFDDGFRLWYIDYGLHGDGGTVEEHPTRSVPYIGALHTALRQLVAWVERGEPPAASTRYEVADGQIRVPPTAHERHGIQPMAALTSDGHDSVDVAIGESVSLHLSAEMPDHAGKIVTVDWDLDGDGTYDVVDDVEPTVQLESTRDVHFTNPGTHFVTAHITAQLDGDPRSIWARVETLARVRVIVSA